jgi:glycosyltransferase involved in cell wall biosynthesis
VKWIDVHGAQPEEVVYSHPSFARNEQAVKVIREAEKCVVEKADIITVQSEVMMSHLLETHGKGLIAYAYQCGADTDKFKPDAWSREQVRRSLGYQSNDCVIVYAGGTASWQMVPETLRLLAALHKHDPRCKGLIVTQSDHETVIKLAKSCGLPEKAFSLRRATHEEVPAYLSASDIGVLLRVDNVVNRVACPTKLGEYLACGLPVIVGPVAKHWPWFLTDNISYTVNNLINVECDAEAVLGFIRAVCVERIATGERCRQMAVEKLSRSRDRNVLQRDVMPVLHRLQNEYRKQKN